MTPGPERSRPSDTPRVSVVIPTYNRATCLKEAIDSVLAQDCPVAELIVVDDGSTDATDEVLAAYGRRLIVVRQANAGPSAARNAGIRVSGGDVLMFLDSDDVWLPSNVRCHVAALVAAGPTTPCCLGNAWLRYADGRSDSSFSLSLIEPPIARGLWLNPLAVLATRFVLFNQCVAVRRAALDRVGTFDETLIAMEDYDLSLRLATLGRWAFVRQPSAVWNEGSAGSLTRRATDEPVGLNRTIAEIHRGLRERSRQAGYAEDAGRDARVPFEHWRRRIRLSAAEWEAARTTTRWAGRLLRQAERVFDKLYTRSPWYPRMRVAPFPVDEDDGDARERAAAFLQRT